MGSRGKVGGRGKMGGREKMGGRVGVGSAITVIFCRGLARGHDLSYSFRKFLNNMLHV